MTAHFTAHAGPCQWSDGDMIIQVTQKCTTIRPGSSMRTLQCIACLNSAGGQPVSILHVAIGEPCAQGYDHLCGLAVLIHERCPTPDDGTLLERLGALLMAHHH